MSEKKFRDKFREAYKKWAKDNAGLDPCIEVAEWGASFALSFAEEEFELMREWTNYDLRSLKESLSDGR